VREGITASSDWAEQRLTLALQTLATVQIIAEGGCVECEGVGMQQNGEQCGHCGGEGR